MGESTEADREQIRPALVSRDALEALLFDMDGVLTATMKLHAACWKEMFDAYLRERSERLGEPFREFEIATDYKRYVDGRLRQEGAAAFLGSRGIDLSLGSPDDSADMETVHGLGQRKDRLVQEHLAQGGVEVFPDAKTFVEWARERDFKVAVVSASKNCEAVLDAGGIGHLFDARVDGAAAQKWNLPGKPKPDTYLKAAELLGVPPSRAAVIEDAISGIEAGRAGNFGCVIGVDRHGNSEPLRSAGADIVVSSLEEGLLDQTMVVAGALTAYAVGVPDPELEAKVNFSRSELARTRDDQMDDRAEAVRLLAEQHLASLSGYGVTSATLDALEAQIAAYTAVVNAPRVATTKVKTVTETIVETFRKADRLLNDVLDRLALQFQAAHPQFYGDYMNAHTIVDLPGSSAEEEGNEETPAPPPNP